MLESAQELLSKYVVVTFSVDDEISCGVSLARAGTTSKYRIVAIGNDFCRRVHM